LTARPFKKLTFHFPFWIGSVSGIILFNTKYTGQNLVKGLAICSAATAMAIQPKLKLI
jgi:hypothetical protein